MTYFNSQVVLISEQVYSNIYLTRQVMAGKNFIDNNFTSAITLDQVCRNACISKYHFIRAFKKIYGRTPYQYLTELRISKAKTLLKNGLSVFEVSFTVGFDSPTSFTGLFKKIVGSTPAAFKKAILKKSNFGEALYYSNAHFWNRVI